MEQIETKYSDKTFENIKHIDEYGNEYWLARELQSILTYKEWRKFENVINKAKNSCNNSGININDHFVEADKMVEIGSGAKRKQKDYILTRYACYLIAQNGDSRKKVIALAQTYFAIQTRRQEITEQEYDALSDDEKRFYQRKLTKQGNYTLQKAAINAGVKNMAEFHNAGYNREDILDNMNKDELVANLFRINQTKQKLIRDNIQGEKEAKNAHYEVGQKVRKAIADIGGTMPEDMLTPKKSLKELEREKKKLEATETKKLETTKL